MKLRKIKKVFSNCEKEGQLARNLKSKARGIQVRGDCRTYETYQSKKPATAKQPKPVSSKQSKPTPGKQLKPMKEKSTKPSPIKKAGKGIQMSLESFQAPVSGVDINEPVAVTIRQLPAVEGKGKDIATKEQAALLLLDLYTPKKKSTTDQYIFQRRTSTTKDAPTGPSAQPEDDTSANIFCDTPSPTNVETFADTDKMNSEGDTEILNIGEEQGEDRVLIEEDQAGPNPGQSNVALAGPNPEPMHDDFIATFINDKSTEEDPGKTNMETKVESMVTVPIHQASSSVPSISTPIIDLTPPKPDQTSQALSSRIFTLENHDLYSNIDKYTNENVKEAVQDAFKAPIHESFRELSEFKMKKILHDRMEEFMDATTKSRKRRRDDQDPPLPPLKGSDQSKKTRHDSDASEQPTDEILIPDDMHLSDSEDTGTDHLSKIKNRPDWLKPIPEEETPKTPELDWVIPPNDLPEPKSNWADAIAKSYQDPEENKLLQKIRDMGSFIKLYYK
ncbi:hypothetical protein Tco_0636155 [Tanacetum coccineum]